MECTKPEHCRSNAAAQCECSSRYLCFNFLDHVPCLFLRDELQNSLPMFLSLHLEPCGNCHTGRKEEKQSIQYFQSNRETLVIFIIGYSPSSAIDLRTAMFLRKIKSTIMWHFLHFFIRLHVDLGFFLPIGLRWLLKHFLFLRYWLHWSQCIQLPDLFISHPVLSLQVMFLHSDASLSNRMICYICNNNHSFSRRMAIVLWTYDIVMSIVVY